MNLSDLQQQPPQFGQQMQMPQQGMEQPMGQPQDLQGLQGAGQQKQQLMEYMSALSQNPSPEVAQQVIAALQQDGSPSAQPLADQISQIMDNPEVLRQYADAIMQKISEL